MTEEMRLGPRAELWECLACDTEFAWHPGSSGFPAPSECPSCDAPHDLRLKALGRSREQRPFDSI